MANVEIPVRRDLGSFTESVTLDGILFLLTFHFNGRIARWVMDIADADDNLLRGGIPMQPDFPLTYKHVRRIDGFPPGQFFIIDETGRQRPPDRETFGKDVKLVYSEAA